MKIKHLLISSVFIYCGTSWASEKQNDAGHLINAELPAPNVLAFTPENFCLGLPNAFAITAQNFTNETEALCPGLVPSQTFRDLLQNPYTGQNNPGDWIRELTSTETITGNNIQIYIAYAMKVPKKAVKALIAEETFVETPYSQGILAINSSFLPPPVNRGEADTAFSIEQKTNVNRIEDPRVVFNDVSRHELRMYRLHPNNFDFFLAVRTLAAPSEQFGKAVVLRGFIADAEAPNDSSYIVTVLNFVMNSRDRPGSNVAEGMRDTFMEFITSDMQSVYRGHTR